VGSHFRCVSLIDHACQIAAVFNAYDLSLYMLMNCPLGVNANAHTAINFRAVNQSFRNWAQQTTANIRIEA